VGRRAFVPWLGFHKESLGAGGQEGIYLCLLFAADGGAVCLTIQQGSSKLTQTELKRRRELLRQRFAILGNSEELALGDNASVKKRGDYAAADVFHVRIPAAGITETTLSQAMDQVLPVFDRVTASLHSLVDYERLFDSGATPANAPPRSQQPRMLHGMLADLATGSQVAGLRLDSAILHRLLASLLAKRFLLLSGLSGSGKTKLAQALAVWMGGSSARGAATAEVEAHGWAGYASRRWFKLSFNDGDVIRKLAGLEEGKLAFLQQTILDSGYLSLGWLDNDPAAGGGEAQKQLMSALRLGDVVIAYGGKSFSVLGIGEVIRGPFKDEFGEAFQAFKGCSRNFIRVRWLFRGPVDTSDLQFRRYKVASFGIWHDTIHQMAPTHIAQLLRYLNETGKGLETGGLETAGSAPRDRVPHKGQEFAGSFIWRVEAYHLSEGEITFCKRHAGTFFPVLEFGKPEDALIILDDAKEVQARIRQDSSGTPNLYGMKEATDWLAGLGAGALFKVQKEASRGAIRTVVRFRKLAAQPLPPPRYALIAVGANWTSKEDLLGYPDALNAGSFRAKPALELLLRATEDPKRPYFLILDEMNLSHVERYFSDFLSAMESGETITLHEGGDWQTDGETPVPAATNIPPNLFVIGTVNVDETTYMFSPKVLDRANVIEFRADAARVNGFLGSPAEVDLGGLAGKGAEFAELFVQTASGKLGTDFDLDEGTKQALQVELDLLFAVLAEHEAEFGFRTAKDVARFMHCHRLLSGDTWQFVQAMDAVVMQKILPKLHGSQAKLTPVLQGLGAVCYDDRAKGRDELLTAARTAASRRDEAYDFVGVDAEAKPRYDAGKAYYPMSFAKIQRMLRKLERDGFASFAEA
jgi:energy-coupling factor transporter ATP-binding protein EcfA2